MEAKNVIESEFNRFGLIAAILTIVGCMGGYAGVLGAIESTNTLIIIVIPTMLTLVFAPMKWIFNAAGACLAIDAMFILYYLLN
ncbi:MAG: hypothetical protein ACKO00_09120 [Crocinitomicaceae bacterium]